MMIIGITGGKGGTGKSTIATSLANYLARSGRVLLVDADVDCPNDHLILGIKKNYLRDVEQRIPQIDEKKCIRCQACAYTCKSNALVSIKDSVPIFIEPQCNGCGSCRIVCKSDAISWKSKVIGKLYFSKNKDLSLLTGELKPNQPISEFIVNALNDEIDRRKEEYDHVIIDTSAGIHCPVISAIKKCERLVAVTEPSPLGAHDLELILKMLDMIDKKAGIVVNRSDIGDIGLIEKIAKSYRSKIILKVPFSKQIIGNYSEQKPIDIENIEKVISIKIK